MMGGEQMSKIALSDGTVISEFSRPYVIAEVNSSHNGSTEVGMRMIDAAYEAGCNCVKFQSWTAKSLYSKSYYQKNPIAKRFVDKLSLSPDELKKMAMYCREKGIGFSSTPYSREEVDFLVDECNVQFVKISSMEVNNPDFLKYIGDKQIPIVLSTGMADYDEVKKAVSVLESAGNRNIAILHCVSIYPAPLETINLYNIIGLREMFPDYPIGFSDHSLGDAAAIAATTLGAAIIEKHITLDSKKIGMDNQMAMEPEDLKVLVKRCEEISIALGSKERKVLPNEYKQRENMRRSIIVTRDIKKGEVISRELLDVKRPGTGISPERLEELIGRTVNKDIESDTLIMESDLDN